MNPHDEKVKKSAPQKQDPTAGNRATMQAQDAQTADPKEGIADLAAQVKRLTDVAGRAQAELLNAKARLEKEGAEIRTYAAEVALLKLLPTIDNFQRALKHLPADIKDHQWVRGVVALEQNFLKQVTDMGLEKFESLGQVIDTSRHEVIMEGPGEKGKVAEVLEDGYELHGKVIRPAKVKVGSGETKNAG